jgi:uncharacterized membrane protein YfcA
MSISDVVILLSIGLLAGILSGLVGIGGGIVIVPVLVYYFAMNQKTAQGTVLFMFLLPIGVLGAFNYYKAGHVDIKSAVIIALTFAVGSYIGSRTAIAIDTKVVKQIFATVMIVIGIKMLLGK